MAYLTLEEFKQITGMSLTNEQTERVTALIPIACSELNVEASKYGKDMSEFCEDEDYLNLVKEILSTAIARYISTEASASPMSQVSESALGYSLSGTYLVPGGGLYLTSGEKKRLGLLRQKYGVLDMWEANDGND